MNRKILVFLTTIFLLMFSIASCSSKPENKSIHLKIFTFEDLKKELHDNKTEVLVINFWATWCGACREEMPDLIQINDDFKGKIKLIGLALDESEDDVIKFISMSKVNFPIYLSSKKLSQHLMVNGIPVTYIFKNGKYVKYHIGKYEYSELKKDILKFLK